jgi:hypothetical protein
VDEKKAKNLKNSTAYQNKPYDEAYEVSQDLSMAESFDGRGDKVQYNHTPQYTTHLPLPHAPQMIAEPLEARFIKGTSEIAGCKIYSPVCL